LIDLDAIVHTLTKKNLKPDRTTPACKAPLCMQLDGSGWDFLANCIQSGALQAGVVLSGLRFFFVRVCRSDQRSSWYESRQMGNMERAIMVYRLP
jgi:hypothetical protein